MSAVAYRSLGLESREADQVAAALAYYLGTLTLLRERVGSGLDITAEIDGCQALYERVARLRRDMETELAAERQADRDWRPQT